MKTHYHQSSPITITPNLTNHYNIKIQNKKSRKQITSRTKQSLIKSPNPISLLNTSILVSIDLTTQKNNILLSMN